MLIYSLKVTNTINNNILSNYISILIKWNINFQNKKSKVYHHLSFLFGSNIMLIMFSSSIIILFF